MKDLYHIMGIPSDASDEQIGAAVRERQDQAAKEAARVLLMPDRRQVYDQVHRTLCTIGTLRDRLDLPESPHWPYDKGSFAGPQAPAPAEEEESGPPVWLWVAGGVIAVAAVVWFLL